MGANTHFIQRMLPFTQRALAQEKIITNFAAQSGTKPFAL
jgi:hypothetical protein